MFVRLVLSCVLLSVLSLSASAQSMPDRVRKSLDQLVGTWEITTDIDGRKVTERVKLEWLSDKNAMVYQGEGENFQTGQKARFTGILGWDPAREIVEESGFDSSGGTFKATHTISAKKWIGTMKAATRMDGESSLETATREFLFDDKDNWVIVCSDRVLNGEKKDTRKLVFRRLADRSETGSAEKCPWEWMLGDWTVQRSDGTSASVTWKIPDASEDHLFGTWKESDGTVLHEIVGWEADRGHLVAHAYGTNGAYFSARFLNVKKHHMSGMLRSRNGEGDTQLGVLEVERVSDGEARSRFVASDGTVITEELRKVKK